MCQGATCTKSYLRLFYDWLESWRMDRILATVLYVMPARAHGVQMRGRGSDSYYRSLPQMSHVQAINHRSGY